MAHVKKFSKGAVGNLFGHFERKQKENGEFIKYGNQDIDVNLSHKNYNLNVSDKKPLEIYHNRLKEVKCLNRSDVKTFCTWVVTVPEDLKNTDKQKDFFKHSFDFLKNRYGEKNVVSSFVHLDETTPHMHFCFMPIIKDKKKDIEKVSAKEVLTRQELINFHKDLKKYLDDKMGIDVKVLNGKTEVNKTIKELKKETKENYLKNEKNSPNFDFKSKDNEIIKEIESKSKNRGIFDKTQVINLKDLKKILNDYVKKYNDLEFKVKDLEFKNKHLRKSLERTNNTILQLHNEKMELLENSKNEIKENEIISEKEEHNFDNVKLELSDILGDKDIDTKIGNMNFKEHSKEIVKQSEIKNSLKNNFRENKKNIELER